MASGIDRARLAGVILSGRSTTVRIDTMGPFDGMFSLSQGAKRGRKVVKGSRKDLRPIGVTAGEMENPVLKLSFAEQTVQQIREGLAALEPNGTSYGDAIGYTISYTLTEPVAETVFGVSPIVYTFDTCWYDEEAGDFPVDTNELKDAMSFGFLGMSVKSSNGIFTLFSSQQ
jgi:hypothetical protein